MAVCLVTQSCPTFCNPIDCNTPGSSVQGMVQTMVLEWVGIPAPGDAPDPRIEP